jgi:hypothetical protein
MILFGANKDKSFLDWLISNLPEDSKRLEGI